tara:strand:+ start:31 stop:996 length:966 start_codon:yes stop_codon:yes gene_type:complete
MLQHIIPIVFSILFGGLIFYLLKKKMTTIENKVNLMFQLIQEHEKKEQLRNNYQQTSNSNYSKNNLIDVSDVDDNSVEESDNNSVEESDDESLQDNNISSNENSKQIAMNLISQLDNTLNMVDGITHSNVNNHNVGTDDESDFDTDETDNNSDKLNIQGSLESLEQNKIISLAVENKDSQQETISLTEIKNISKSDDNVNTLEDNISQSNDNIHTTQSNDINHDSDVENNDNDSDVENNDNDSDVENNNGELDKVTLDDDLDKVTLDDDLDNEQYNNQKKNISEILKGYTVSELKKECTKRNLSNFRSLKKTALIELLENS